MRTWSSAAEDRQRRREIRRRLADSGLTEGPRRLAPELRAIGPVEHVRRLRRVLTGLGPVFAAFGRYLSLRPDLLGVGDCQKLAAIADRRTAAPAAAVLERLAGELGGSVAELFVHFEEEPGESRLLWQAHRARLASGRRVTVRLIRPGLEAEIERDLGLLPQLRPALAPWDLPLDETIGDFRRDLERRLDLGRQAEALELLGREAVDSGLLAVPRVETALSGAKVLTVECLDGVRLGEEEGRLPDPGRRLALIWLQQALVSRPFPVEADVLELDDGRLAVTAGLFAELPTASQPNLWEYLRHTAAHHPDRAGECLLRELRRRKRADVSRLQLQLRQVVPFRDGCWTERGDTLAEHLILHWRVARECGFGIAPPLTDFYRGLLWVARLGSRLAPSGDPLRAAQEDLRWLAGWARFRHLSDPRQLGESLEKNLASLLELPQKLDDVLELAAAEPTRLRLRATGDASRQRKKNASAVVISLGLTMAALVLFSGELPALGWSPQWSERIGAVAFLALGVLVLWAAGRR